MEKNIENILASSLMADMFRKAEAIADKDEKDGVKGFLQHFCDINNIKIDYAEQDMD